MQIGNIAFSLPRRVKMYAVLLLVSLMTSCSLRTNLMYGFKPSAFADKGISGGAKLIGTYHSDKHQTVFASPYSLLVWFQSTTDSLGAFTLRDVELVDESNGQVSFQSSTVIVKPQSPEVKGSRGSIFSFEGLVLGHRNYILHAKYDFTPSMQGDTIRNREVTVKIEKEFRKYRSSDFLDRLGSISPRRIRADKV